jgi:hypothetical protein
LKDHTIQQKMGYLGVEPVTFVEKSTDMVSLEDSTSCIQRIQQLGRTLKCVSPDVHLYAATSKDEWAGFDLGIRNGPRGSVLIDYTHAGRSVTIPAASLSTVDGNPVNPTGAGNAYAAALTVCRALGVPLVDAGCIASAIGAVVCEYDHIPPWTSAVIDRLRVATNEVRTSLAEDDIKN